MLQSPEQGESFGSFLFGQAQYFGAYNTAVSVSNAMGGFTGGKLGGFFGWMAQDAMGRRPDVINARKILGTTAPGNIYNKLAYGKGYTGLTEAYDFLRYMPGGDSRGAAKFLDNATPSIARYIPSLAHASPSRHLTMLSAYGGNVGGITTVQDGTSMARLMRMTNPMGGHPLGYTQTALRESPLGSSPLKTKLSSLGKMFGANIPQDLSLLMEDIGNFSKMAPAPGFEDEIAGLGKKISAYGEKGEVAGMRRAIGEMGEKMGMTGTWADTKTMRLAQKMAGNSMGRWAMSKGIPAAAGIGSKILVGSNLVGLGLMAADTIWWAGSKAVGAAVGGAKVLTEDFRRDRFMSTGGLPNFVGSSYRERSMAVMQQTGLALNQVLGNEASYF
jgi:hypothetical protein